MMPPPHRTLAKAATHRRIVGSASRLIRRDGLAGSSVERVMRGAGLTVGGFYAHFPSKHAMDVEVLEDTLAEIRARAAVRLGDAAGLDWLSETVRHYLSADHRDRPGTGCPLPAVVGDAAHADPRMRRAIGRFLDQWADRIASHAPERGAAGRQRALATVALLVGGLTIARGLRGQALSDEFLEACTAWALPELRSPSTRSSSPRRPPRRRRRPSRP